MLSALSSVVLFFVFCLRASVFVAGQDQQTLWPAAVPLAVRSPYLSAWINTVNGSNPSASWPRFWDGKRILGWSGFVRVDGSTWQWLGERGNTTTVKNIQITPTRTVITQQAGPMELTVTYLDPVEPTDLVMQSFPFAYMAVNVTSTDGNPHSVQLYSDISGEWASGDNKNIIAWTTNQTTTSIFHAVHRIDGPSLSEINNIAEDSRVYYGMRTRSGLTWQTGTDDNLRGSFAKNGKLTNVQDPTSRQINGVDWPVFALSVDLGTISATSQPSVWAIGLVRDPSIRVQTSSIQEDRSPYFWTRYRKLQDAIDAFLLDFPNAYNRAIDLDQKITSEAMKISANYADLVSLATRQALAGLEITTSKLSNGSYDQSDIKAFMKDIGTHRSNPVEAIYAAFPALLYLNTSIAGYTLSPLLEYQSNSVQNLSFAMSDLGQTFPSVTEGSSNEIRAVEDTSSMLIMVYAHALFSGDGSLISKYYPLLRRWANYLNDHALNPTNQQTQDNLGGDRSVNLILKGIIAIQAMAGISQAFGDDQASQTYRDRAKSFAAQWKDEAMHDGHLIWNLDDPASWGLIYNLYADKLIRSNLVEQQVYDSQATFYRQSSPGGTFGLPLASNTSSITRSDWTMFTAGAMDDATTRDLLVSMVHARASYNATTGVFPTAYDSNTGAISSGIASPAQGAMYSLMALSLQPQTITIPPETGDTHSNDRSSSSGNGGLSGGAIAGIVISSLGAIIIPGIAFLIWRRKRAASKEQDSERMVEPFIETNGHLPVVPCPEVPVAPTERGGKRQLMMEMRRDEMESMRASSMSVPSTSPGNRTTPSMYTSDQGPSETEQLRSAVDDLRREITLMRGYVEPPPEY